MKSEVMLIEKAVMVAKHDQLTSTLLLSGIC
jgi:hypothetical protein